MFLSANFSNNCAQLLIAIGLAATSFFSVQPALAEQQYAACAFSLDSEETDDWHVTHNIPGLGVVVGAENGLFLVTDKTGEVRTERVGKLETGAVTSLLFFSDSEWLVSGDRGLFVARVVNNVITLATSDVGKVEKEAAFPNGDRLIISENGTFVARAKNNTIEFSRITTPIGFDLLWEAEGWGILAYGKSGRYLVRSEGDKVQFALFDNVHESLDAKSAITDDEKTAELLVSYVFKEAGRWSFQVVSTFDGVDEPVGERQYLSLLDGEWWKFWWSVLTISALIMLAMANILLFLFARRSKWAWRVATSNNLSSSAFSAAIDAAAACRNARVSVGHCLPIGAVPMEREVRLSPDFVS